MQPLVSVIIVNWNGLDILARCLDSLQQQNYQPLQIIVLDNASSDGSVALIENSFPQVALIKNQFNAGFALGNNLGAKIATGKYLFLLNSDAWVKVATIGQLVKTLEEQPQIGLLGAKLLNPDGSFQEAGMRIDIFGFPFAPSFDYVSKNSPQGLFTNFFYVGGAAVLLERALFEHLGGFDESYFMFCEDVDLAWRARLLGEQAAVCLEAEVYHQGGASLAGGVANQGGKYQTSLKRIYLRERNNLAMLLSNYSLVWLLLILPICITLNMAEILVLTLLGRFNIARCYLDAYSWNIKRLPQTWQKRKLVQKQRVVADKELWPLFYHGLGKLISLKTTGGLPQIADASR